MIDSHIERHSPSPRNQSRLTTLTETWQDDAREDLLLLCRIAVHDAQAFEHLYWKYKPKLERYLAKYLQQPPTVEEACNDVMLVVWKKAAQFQPTSKVSTWIFGIARIEARRAHAQTLPPLDAPTANASQDLDINTPERSLAVQQQVNTLAQAVAALPPTLRTPIVLSYYHDYSYAQIATHMNCASDTVKVRLRQARRRLGAALRRADHKCPLDEARRFATPCT